MLLALTLCTATEEGISSNTWHTLIQFVFYSIGGYFDYVPTCDSRDVKANFVSPIYLLGPEKTGGYPSPYGNNPGMENGMVRNEYQPLSPPDN